MDSLQRTETRWPGGRRRSAKCASQPDQLIKYFRDTLEYVKPHKNVTLSLPESLLRRFRIYAASRNQSMTSLMAEAIRTLIEQDGQSAKAKRRFLDRIQNAPDRGTRGKISWTREELHERRVH